MAAMKVAVFDTKPYDREFLSKRGGDIDWDFHESSLRPETAALAEGADAVCVFVNDCVDARLLAELSLRKK